MEEETLSTEDKGTAAAAAALTPRPLLRWCFCLCLLLLGWGGLPSSPRRGLWSLLLLGGRQVVRITRVLFAGDGTGGEWRVESLLFSVLRRYFCRSSRALRSFSRSSSSNVSVDRLADEG